MCLPKKKRTSEASRENGDPAASSVAASQANTPELHAVNQSKTPVQQNSPPREGENENEKKSTKDQKKSIKSKKSVKSHRSAKQVKKPVTPPRVRVAKRAPKGTKEAKDPQYATLDGDYPSFALAVLNNRVPGRSRGASQKSQKRRPASVMENATQASFKSVKDPLPIPSRGSRESIDEK